MRTLSKNTCLSCTESGSPSRSLLYRLWRSRCSGSRSHALRDNYSVRALFMNPAVHTHASSHALMHAHRRTHRRTQHGTQRSYRVQDFVVWHTSSNVRRLSAPDERLSAQHWLHCARFSLILISMIQSANVASLWCESAATATDHFAADFRAAYPQPHYQTYAAHADTWSHEYRLLAPDAHSEP